ncbi:MAG: hypothetical protein KJO02_09290, partial [Erythrobacter sp.]|nr:hypothetical protein [Erythrobacter sp.]
DDVIVVTASKVRRDSFASVSPLSVVSEEAMAREENLADFKLYRVPRPVTVSSKGMKQIAFLSREAIRTRWLYEARCEPDDEFYPGDEEDLEETTIRLFTENTVDFGLGASLPMGKVNAFENTTLGPQLVAELELRDYPVGQEVELPLGDSAKVFALCGYEGETEPDDNGARWTKMRMVISNANEAPIRVRINFGFPGEWEVRPGRTEDAVVKNGDLVVEAEVPGNGTYDRKWRVRRPPIYFADD